ncbi:MAG: peptidylprolyl isomerase [Mangrovibacterium sp.]
MKLLSKYNNPVPLNPPPWGSWRGLLFLLFLFAACTPQKQEQKKNTATEKAKPVSGFAQYKSRIGELRSYDGDRLLETETAFFVDSNLIAARLSPIMDASRVELETWDGKIYRSTSFVAVDRTNKLVLLHTSSNPDGGIALQSALLDTVCEVKFPTAPKNNVLSVKVGSAFSPKNTKGALNYPSTFAMYEKTYGSPIFSGSQCIGLGFADVVDFEKQGLIVPSTIILQLAKNKAEARQFAELKSKSSKATSLANSKIKGLVIETDLGDISIRLFNETPEYRDNFIALVREQYYDSLLIHRVIPGFCIQSGAADTKYAQAGDVVGWQGPGYTLPAHIVPSKFHKRGVISSPRKPDRVNSKQRSDGSQFFIVTGRRYSDSELDVISKETGHQFTAEQREYYRTIGGAPHVDGSYTIFGEVISGIEVADKINAVSVGKDYRPMNDVRIKRVRVME